MYIFCLRSLAKLFPSAKLIGNKNNGIWLLIHWALICIFMVLIQFSVPRGQYICVELEEFTVLSKELTA